MAHGTSLPLCMISASVCPAPHATCDVRKKVECWPVQLTDTGVGIQHVLTWPRPSSPCCGRQGVGQSAASAATLSLGPYPGMAKPLLKELAAGRQAREGVFESAS